MLIAYLCISVPNTQSHSRPGGDDLVSDVGVRPHAVADHSHGTNNFQAL